MAQVELDSELKGAIDRYVASDALGEDAREVALPTVVKFLSEHKVQLLDIVLHLEKALGDASNPAGRRQAVQLLTDCLCSTQAQVSLNFKHVETLAGFFSSKFTDWQCVGGAVGGVLALLQHHGPVLRTLTTSSGAPFVTELARKLLQEVHVQSHTQQVRRSVLDTARLLLEQWRTEVTKLGPALGEGIFNAIDEERDPRNLLLSFAVSKHLLEEFDAECVSEKALGDIFETLTSYFPITFSPPKDDKFHITGDDLRAALTRALSVPRLATLVVPFLLDSSKDITIGDNTDSIRQALEMLPQCLEGYGPEVARAHLGSILTTARDQVCRTETPCPTEFAAMVQRTLEIALTGVPAGLCPHWFARDVDPVLKNLSEDAAQGDLSLASAGAKRLLLAAAASHSTTLERVWALATPRLLLEKGQPILQPSSVPFMLDLANLADLPSRKVQVLAPRQVKPVLAGAVASLLSGLNPHGNEAPSEEGVLAEVASVPTLVSLVGSLARLAGEGASGEAFEVLKLMLLPTTGEPGHWAHLWHKELADVPATGEAAEDVRATALVGAVAKVVAAQPGRAAELAPGLLLACDGPAPWLKPGLPRLLAATVLSLARRAAGTATAATAGDSDSEEPGQKAVREAEAKAMAQEAAAVAESLLAKLASMVKGPCCEAAAAAAGLDSIAQAFAEAPKEKKKPGGALEWAALRLQTALRLPDDLLSLGGAGALVGEVAPAVVRRVLAAQRLLRTLGAELPRAAAEALRLSVFKLVASTSKAPGDEVLAVVFVSAALPAAAAEDWQRCAEAVPAVCRCASTTATGLLEPLALEALGSLVEACPTEQVEALLEIFRSTFGELLQGKSVDASPAASRGAVRCWAAAASALLRRGGFAAQAAAFLEALLTALDQSSPVVRCVPLAFQVLMPPDFGDGGGAAAAVPKLPPLALQQLSRTTLPALLARAKGGASLTVAAKQAALESAVTLLSALPVEVACTDCTEELQWCTLTGLKTLKEAGASSAPSDGAVFSAQVLQLFVRALDRSSAWIEDNLQSVVPPLASICITHAVPLVRLASLQALGSLCKQSHGHLIPYKKQIEAATGKAIEDRRREVRLMGVATLNSWHCGLAVES